MKLSLRFYIISFLLVLFSVRAISQDLIYHCVDQSSEGNGIERFSGNASIKTGDITIFGDLIIYNSNDKNMDVIGHPKIIQGKTIITCNNLTYNSATKLGKFRQDVKVVDNETKLYTDFLDFNSETKTGFFYNGGKVIDTASTLTCKNGYFYTSQKLYFFKDSVQLKTEKYILLSDTLKYNTEKKIAYVFGPTTITSKTDFIYCENGWYDTKNDIAQFNKKALLKNNKQRLTGDSLFYDRKKGLGKSFTNVELWDSTENIMIRGGYAVFNQKPEKALIYKKALFMQISNGDTLYLHADTLRSDYNEVGKYKTLKAYKHAQIFKTDFQSRSDSIHYSFQDSTIKLYKSPILWASGNQITGDSVRIFTKKNRPDKVEIGRNSFIVSLEGDMKFNQIKGISMTGYFSKNELVKLIVNSNAQSLYYAKDKTQIIGLNKVECGKMIIYLKDRKLERIIFQSKPVASLIPLEKLKPVDLLLEGFFWYEKLRPTRWQEVYFWK